MTEREIKEFLQSLKDKGVVIKKAESEDEGLEDEENELDDEYESLTAPEPAPALPPLLNPYEKAADRILSEIRREQESERDSRLHFDGFPIGIYDT